MSVYQDLMWRELGDVRQRGDPLTFRRDVLASQYLLETYSLKGLLKGHTGCVNSVLFSNDGGFIYTGSDDTDVNIYETDTLKKVETLRTVHTSNIFYARDIPGSDMNLVLTCAADGRVVLTNMVTKEARKLHRHRGRAHRIALVPFENDQFYSCGEDGACCLFDIRDNASRMFRSEAGAPVQDENVFAPVMTAHFKNNREKICSIYTVGVNPLKSYQVAVGGSSNHISLYDSRKFTDPVSYFCPQHLASSPAHVTGLKYDHTGEMLIGSYNDDDVYSFLLKEDTIETRRRPAGANRTRAESTESTEGSPAADLAPEATGYYRRYAGHRNNNTVKQVSFMGGRSDYVISGSDCGHIFIWNTQTAEVVQLLKADEVGAINCLAPHPVLPILATSGLENDAKIWQPSGEHKPIAPGTEKKKTLTQLAARNAERNQRDTYSSALLNVLMDLFQRGDLPLHDMNDSDGSDGDGESDAMEAESDENADSEGESGGDGSEGDDSDGSGYSSHSHSEGEGDSHSSDSENHIGDEEDEDEDGMDFQSEEGERSGEQSGEDRGKEAGHQERVVAGAGRSRWTRRPVSSADSAVRPPSREVLPTEHAENSDSSEYGPQPASSAATDPPPAASGQHRHHRRHRQRPGTTRTATRAAASRRREGEEEEEEAHEEEGDDGNDSGEEITMQDVAQGRVSFVIDGVSVPFASLLPALLGRRRRRPVSDSADEREEEEQGEQGGQEHEGAGLQNTTSVAVDRNEEENVAGTAQGPSRAAGVEAEEDAGGGSASAMDDESDVYSPWEEQGVKDGDL